MIAIVEMAALRGELAAANRECEIRAERELGYLARAQSAEAECDALRERADKFMWQVRDTCARAEKAEVDVERLRASIEEAIYTMDLTRVFLTSRERIHPDAGLKWYDETVERLRAAIAAPEGRG